MVATDSTRKLLTDGTADAPYPVPPENVFGSGDFWKDSRLDTIGEALIAKHFRRIDQENVRIGFLWKKKGGTSGGNLTLGKCIKLTGLARHFSRQDGDDFDYLIWCASDHARSMRLTNYQVEALLYHELLHVEIEEPEDEGKPLILRTRGHDFEGFIDELMQYGRWRPSMESMAAAFQAALPFENPRDGAADAARDFVRKTFKPGGGIDSVTFSAPDMESVTITREDAERIRTNS